MSPITITRNAPAATTAQGGLPNWPTASVEGEINIDGFAEVVMDVKPAKAPVAVLRRGGRVRKAKKLG